MISFGEDGTLFLYWGGLLRHSEEEGIRLLKICNFCVLFSIAKISIPVGMFRRWLLILAIEQTDRQTDGHKDFYYRYEDSWPTPD